MVSLAMMPRNRDLLGLPARKRPEAHVAGFPPPKPKGQEPAKCRRIFKSPEPAGPDPGVARNEREERRNDVLDRRPVDGPELRAFLDACVRAQVPENVGFVLQGSGARRARRRVGRRDQRRPPEKASDACVRP